MTNISDIVRALGGEPARWKSSNRYPCPLCGSSDGVAVGEGVKQDVVVSCHAGGCDVFGWLRQSGVVNGRANGSTTWSATRVQTVQTARGPSEDERRDLYRTVLELAKASGKKPTAYLRARGVEKTPTNAYLLPAYSIEEKWFTFRYYPCAVFPIVKRGKVIGCHVIALNRDGDGKLAAKKPKKSYGFTEEGIRGGYVRLGQLADAETLIVAEGVEDALSASQLDSGTPAIATVGTSGMKSEELEVPPCDQVIIARDRDIPRTKAEKEQGKPPRTAGREAAEALARRLSAQGRDVIVAVSPSNKWKDWNDVLRKAPNPKEVWERALEAGQEEPAPDPFGWTKEFEVTASQVKKILKAKMAIEGQIPHAQSLIYLAPAGSGKTTLLEHQAEVLVACGYKVIHVNSDIPQSDALRAIAQAKKVGYQLLLPDLAEGGKDIKDVVDRLAEMAQSDLDLNGHALLLTNLKRMTDVINKSVSKILYTTIGKLRAKGMTVVIEGHTNKYPGHDGKWIYEGTNELPALIDNLVYLYAFKHPDNSLTVAIEPDRKIRAPLEQLTFRMSPKRELTWCDEYIDVFNMLQNQRQREKDQPTIELITEVLRKRRDAVESRIVAECQKAGVGQRTTRRVLAEYTGELWTMSKSNERNAKIYSFKR